MPVEIDGEHGFGDAVQEVLSAVVCLSGGVLSQLSGIHFPFQTTLPLGGQSQRHLSLLAGRSYGAADDGYGDRGSEVDAETDHAGYRRKSLGAPKAGEDGDRDGSAENGGDES